MLELMIHMNSSITEVMEWKCCSINGLNLELIFHNTGETAMAAPGCFVLENGEEKLVIDLVYPPWPQKIAPNDYASIYCSMEDKVWQKYHTLCVRDAQGQVYRYPIDHSIDPAGCSKPL